GGLHVLAREPERTVVGFVDAHGGVIAPAVRTALLRTCPHSHVGLSLSHLAGRIGGQATGVPDGWEQTAARDAVADGDVAIVIGGDRRHPTMICVWSKRARSEERRCREGV